MSMSTHIVGYREEDEQWKKMKKVWESCELAGIEPPHEVAEFFDFEDPEEKNGLEIDLGKAVSPWRDESREGYELDVSKLPKGLKIVRFFNAF